MDYIFDNERPIYIQLVEKLRMEIISGKLKPGERIPSVRELAITARVNPNTMQKALVELEDEGLLFTERTNGKFVTENKELIEKIKKELAKEKVNNYLKDMKNIGIDYDEALKYLQELERN
ncbi:MAG: GntR family transcriptional regulator [Clostridia bacterium]|nr:GntR family transcriptional regulator [Clostridia bacterium]